MRYVFLLGLAITLYGGESLVVIANKNFPLDTLSNEQVKQIYLRKIRFIDTVLMIPLNYAPTDPLRQEFERSVMKMSPQKLKRYWMKKHYQGVRPPLTQNSSTSALLFVKKVDGAIAYIPQKVLGDHTHDIIILYH